MDYYKELEIERDASESEIKKAYRKLSLEWHPDRNPQRLKEAEEKFKRISESYQVLSDPEKKQQYDTFGHVQEGGGMPGAQQVDPNDIFKMFFGGAGGMPGGFPGMGSMFQSGGPMHRQKVSAKMDVLEFPLETFFTGGKKKVTTRLQELCGGCNGIGGINMRSCANCQGNGFIQQMRMIGPGMVQRIQSNCERCQGKGKIPEKSCQDCQGQKVKNISRTFIIDIEPGMKEGDRIVFQSGGNDLDANCERGDMIFYLKEKKSDRYERRGNDLFYQQNILLGDSLLGYWVELDHFGTTLRYYEDGIIEPNSMRRIRMKGMPIRGENGNYGDLYIVYKVKYPNQKILQDEEKEMIRKIFPSLQGERDEKPIRMPNSDLISP